MSHLRTCQVQIKNANKEVLEQALKSLAFEMGDELVVNGTITDYYGRATSCQYAFKKLGYGVNITNGEIQVVGDDWKKNINLSDFSKKVAQAYTVQATTKALRSLGFSVSQQKRDNAIYLFGIKV